MKKTINYSIFFIFVYLIFLVVTVPASYVLQQVTLPKNIQVNQIDGTIWHFTAKSIVVDKQVINQVEGKVSALSFLSFMPSAYITFGKMAKSGPKGYLTVSSDGTIVLIEDAKITLPASELVSQFRLPFPIEANGSLVANIASYQLGQPYCTSLNAKVQWTKAEVMMKDDIIALGNYLGKLTCDKGTVGFILDDKNDLGLSYSAYLQPNGKASGDGFLTPGEKFPAVLKSLLPLLGKPDNQGRYRLYF